jgi:hypothetical protein
VVLRHEERRRESVERTATVYFVLAFFFIFNAGIFWVGGL